jgi:hypothetical protein
MITLTDWHCQTSLINQALKERMIPAEGIRLNDPTGNFFYDKWKIKAEYVDSAWGSILNTLPIDIGEARVIILDTGRCYQAHADIDDRYHLNIQSENSFLIDLENNLTYKICQDGAWYQMDAGRLHSAANLGRCFRIQLVVRQLLTRNHLVNPINIEISSDLPKDDSRYLFDQTTSVWLNRANKSGVINNFKYSSDRVGMEIEQASLPELRETLDNNFNIKII